MPQKRTMVTLVCPVCEREYQKAEYEHKRNQRLGRTSVCGRSCHATFMNTSGAKLALSRAQCDARNANQYRENNPNWKGGVSALPGPGRGKPLKPIPATPPEGETGG